MHISGTFGIEIGPKDIKNRASRRLSVLGLLLWLLTFDLLAQAQSDCTFPFLVLDVKKSVFCLCC